jgi:hypothetical protein
MHPIVVILVVVVVLAAIFIVYDNKFTILAAFSILIGFVTVKSSITKIIII